MTTSTRPTTADELIAGELIELTPSPGSPHAFSQNRLSTVLDNFARPRALGAVFTECGFLISTDPDTVRAPDVAFVSIDRLPAEGLLAGYMPMAPDLAVEVVSPSDRATYIQGKVRAWLDAGSRLVWVAYPSTRSVTAHLPGGETIEFAADDILDGAPVLEGLQARVSSLFDLFD